MAEDGKKEGQANAAEPAKKFPVMIVVLGVVAVLLLGGGAFAWKSGLLNNLVGDEGGSAGETIEKKSTKPEIGPIYSLGSFIVNLMEPLGKRYLKIKIELELEAEQTRPEIEKRMPQLRDAVLTMLSSKTYNDISDLSGKFQLRAEMQSVLNGYMTSGKILNVYFTEFIVQ
jgi:flagellar FliL protein